MSKNNLNAALVLGLALTFSAGAARLGSVTASSNQAAAFGTNLASTVNGAGLSSLSLTATHAIADPFNCWVFGAVPNGTQTVTFDLGGSYRVSGLTFWNFFGDPTAGVQAVSFSTSMDGVTFGPLSGAPTVFAQVTTGAPATYSFPAVAAKYIRMTIISNHGYPTATGFDEIAFDGVPGGAEQPAINAYPTSLSLQYQQGTVNPLAPQLISILETAINAPWTAATSGESWLQLSGATGGNPGTVTASVNPAGLAPGTYSSTITISGGGLTTLVPVSLVVTGPASLAVSPASIAVAASLGQNSASTVPLTISSPVGGTFAITQSAPVQPWLKLSTASGTGPATVQVTLDSTGLNAGTYLTTLLVTSPLAPNSPLKVPVSMSVTGFQAVSPWVNAASFKPSGNALASNELVALFLPNVACPQKPEITVNGAAGQTLAWGGGQLNLVTPPGSTAGTLAVSCGGTPLWRYSGYSVAPAVPGLFAADQSGNGQATAVNLNGTLNGASNPAKRGEPLTLFGTGFGDYLAPDKDGLRRVAAPLTVLIGGVPAVVTYAGESPGQTLGLTQLNLTVPAGVTPGNAVPVVVTAGVTPSQNVLTVAVQ